MSGPLVTVAIGLPLVLAVTVLHCRLRSAALRVAPWAALPALVLVMHPSPAPTLKFPWLLLGTRLGIDTTTQVFLFFIALLWTCAGVYALHVWLPLAHPVAPTPASAVLSGAMIKAGLLGWLRFLPLGEAATPGWGNVCTIAGLAAAFDGVLVGCTQDNAKTVLAYSSISQMGFMTMAVGVGLTVPAVWTQALTATALYALHHAMDGDACVMTG